LNKHTVAVSKVTALDHEVLDDTVECRTLISKALLASRESAEVFSGLGCGLAVQAYDHTAQLLVAVCNVKVDLLLVLAIDQRYLPRIDHQSTVAESTS
jgi:hypothetical protein